MLMQICKSVLRSDMNSIASLAGGPGSSADPATSSSMLVMSGGEGYIDFRIGECNPLKDHLGIVLPAVIRRPPLKFIILLLIGHLKLFIYFAFVLYLGNIVKGIAHHLTPAGFFNILCSLMSFSFPVHPVYLLQCSNTGWSKMIDLCVGTIVLSHPVNTILV